MQQDPSANKDNNENFPGYPHYNAKEDITDKRNDTQKVGSDPDTLGANAATNGVEQRSPAVPAARNADEAEADTDITQEDLQLLNASGLNQDLEDQQLQEATLDQTDADGDPLNEVSTVLGQTGADLDVPGSEADDGDENIGEEDEENNYYSLGGDNHENLEEDNG